MSEPPSGSTERRRKLNSPLPAPGPAVAASPLSKSSPPRKQARNGSPIKENGSSDNISKTLVRHPSGNMFSTVSRLSGQSSLIAPELQLANGNGTNHPALSWSLPNAYMGTSASPSVSGVFPHINPPLLHGALRSSSATPTLIKGDGTCPICLQNLAQPVVAPCGHEFCRQCIMTDLENQTRQKDKAACCPTCGSAFPSDSNPNTYLNVIADPTALEFVTEKTKALSNLPELAPSAGSSDLKKILMDVKKLNVPELNALLEDVTREINTKLKDEQLAKGSLAEKFLRLYHSTLQKDIDNVKRRVELVCHDLQYINNATTELSLSKALSSTPYTERSVLSEPTVSLSKSLPAAPAAWTMPTNSKVDMCWERALQHFPAVADFYAQMMPNFEGDSFRYSGFNDVLKNSTDARIKAVGDMVRGIGRYAKVDVVATLNYDIDDRSQLAIVSSLEFDREGQLFVVAGVSRKIKMFNYQSVIESPTSMHYPLKQLQCKSKISNVSWNPSINYLLCSSDYEGLVTVWDTAQGKEQIQYKEHEKRCWSVNFNNVDHSLMASGSDDWKVKLWDIRQARSVGTIDAKVNVCCVNFSPNSRNDLVFGCADHAVHMYDIRNTQKHVRIFKGHQKAVSYVRYINDRQVVSASTDSSLRIWDAESGSCVRELRGHQNEKNFVGLSSSGDHIVCGSEDSHVYFYYKDVPKSIMNYHVGKTSNGEEAREGFVSSVCWKKNSDVVLVANSLGQVQVLQLS